MGLGQRMGLTFRRIRKRRQHLRPAGAGRQLLGPELQAVRIGGPPQGIRIGSGQKCRCRARSHRGELRRLQERLLDGFQGCAVLQCLGPVLQPFGVRQPSKAAQVERDDRHHAGSRFGGERKIRGYLRETGLALVDLHRPVIESRCIRSAAENALVIGADRFTGRGHGAGPSDEKGRRSLTGGMLQKDCRFGVAFACPGQRQRPCSEGAKGTGR